MGSPQLMGTPSFRERRWANSWWMPWVVVAAVFIAAAVHTTEGGGAAGAGGAARIGSPAPDFTLQLFNGKSITLSSLRGKPVVVNFWHSG